MSATRWSQLDERSRQLVLLELETAKNAETLDEMLGCLQRAQDIIEDALVAQADGE